MLDALESLQAHFKGSSEGELGFLGLWSCSLEKADISLARFSRQERT
jgi:hypothetical protein